MPSKPSKPFIIIYLSGYRPHEHLQGLIYLAKADKKNRFVFIKSILYSSYSINSDFNFTSAPSLRNILLNLLTIRQSHLIFGSPSLLVRIILKLSLWNGYLISILPGKITKGVGFFKNQRLSLAKILKNALTTNFLNLRIIATDVYDAVYLSSAHAYPINHIITTLLPKHYYINSLLQSLSPKKSILFAPTERDFGFPSPILLLLRDKKFVDLLISYGLQILYSHHPYDKNSLDIDPRIIMFSSSDWKSVGVVVSDYSSIGSDFLCSGGSAVIYYIPDQDYFKSKYGFGPFMEQEFSKGHVISNYSKLCSTIKQLCEYNLMHSANLVDTIKGDFFDSLILRLFH